MGAGSPRSGPRGHAGDGAAAGGGCAHGEAWEQAVQQRSLASRDAALARNQAARPEAPMSDTQRARANAASTARYAGLAAKQGAEPIGVGWIKNPDVNPKAKAERDRKQALPGLEEAFGQATARLDSAAARDEQAARMRAADRERRVQEQAGSRDADALVNQRSAVANRARAPFETIFGQQQARDARLTPDIAAQRQGYFDVYGEGPDDVRTQAMAAGLFPRLDEKDPVDPMDAAVSNAEQAFFEQFGAVPTPSQTQRFMLGDDPLAKRGRQLTGQEATQQLGIDPDDYEQARSRETTVVVDQEDEDGKVIAEKGTKARPWDDAVATAEAAAKENWTEEELNLALADLFTEKYGHDFPQQRAIISAMYRAELGGV